MPRVKKYGNKKCVICKKTFTTEITNKRGRNRKTCGDRGCQDKPRLQTTYFKSCDICEKEYETVRQNSKYCSDKCRKQRHEVECCICNSKFRADRTSTKLCSLECEKIHRRENTSTVKCTYCDSVIERSRNYVFKNKNNFCDYTCGNNYWGFLLYSGKSKYGGNWGTIRKEIIEYYSKECQRCSCSITLKTCNIHHIVPIKYFKDCQISIANSIENLIPLCVECHKIVHIENNSWYEETFGECDFLKI